MRASSLRVKGCHELSPASFVITDHHRLSVGGAWSAHDIFAATRQRTGAIADIDRPEWVSLFRRLCYRSANDSSGHCQSRAYPKLYGIDGHFPLQLPDSEPRQ